MVWFVSITLVIIFIFLIKEGDERVIGFRCCRCSRLRCHPGSMPPGESLDFRLTVSLKGSRNFLIDIGELIRVVGRIFVGHAPSRVGDVTEESAANLHGVHRL